MSRPITRTEKLDRETISFIKGLCAEFGILRSTYYEHSDLGSPGAGQISYMGFLAAVGGGPVTPEQEARIDRSMGQVRQALRKAGRAPLIKELPAQLKAALIAFEEDPDVFESWELTVLRGILARATARLR